MLTWRLKGFVTVSSAGKRIIAMFRIQMLAFVIASAMAVALCLCFTLPRAIAGAPAGTFELERKINPNVASPESLARLPGIGRTRAQAIVTYREKFYENSKGDLAFQDCADLQNVKGIGPGITDDMCQYLKFDGE
jgi:competence ComEA-like helix-hairpin-helix protein